ncbi:MAG TPA: isochorismatase family cysteine hydrolase [Desulfuromonadales bacterium]|nr:isochorismatase family cysteine hydrolase [Desulfuromonadales bacterium]
MAEVLLVIDMLNDFVLPGAPLEVPATRSILPALQRRLEAAREAGTPVVFVCDAHVPDDPEFSRMNWPPHAVRGSSGARVVDELAPRAKEPVIAKTTYSGFFGTELEATLRKLKAEDVVLTGCVTNICILYTAADAAMRGYRVRVPVDAVASLDEAEGAFALTQMEKVLGVKVER